jgi:hypothetical protein
LWLFFHRGLLCVHIFFQCDFVCRVFSLFFLWVYVFLSNLSILPCVCVFLFNLCPLCYSIRADERSVSEQWRSIIISKVSLSIQIGWNLKRTVIKSR